MNLFDARQIDVISANIEVLRNARAHTIRIAPLFDHGLSLVYSCMTDAAAQKFNELEDKRCQNFIGTYSCYDNLNLIKEPRNVFRGKLSEHLYLRGDVEKIRW